MGGEKELGQPNRSKFQKQNLMPLVLYSLCQGVSSFKDSIRSLCRTSRSSGPGNPFKIKSYLKVRYQLIFDICLGSRAYLQLLPICQSGLLGNGLRFSLHVLVPTGGIWVLYPQFRTLHGWQILGILGEGVLHGGSCCLYWRVAVGWISFSLLLVYGQKDRHLPPTLEEIALWTTSSSIWITLWLLLSFLHSFFSL